MGNTAKGFFAGCIFMLALGGGFLGYSEYQRKAEERRVIEFLKF